MSSNIITRKISDLEGLSLIDVQISKEKNMIYFVTSNTGEGNRVFKMCHYQDCCEDVYIEDIVGDINDIRLSPIIIASEDQNKGFESGLDGSSTWTFYTLATVKGGVTIRWYGSSNGYYSESVDFVEVLP